MIEYRILQSIALIIIIISTGILGHAQDEWASEVACMGDLQYPIVPRSEWDFEGVIVASDDRDNVVGVRGDIQADYVIALESDATYTISGSFSPDGQYFAYPIGEPTYNVNAVGDSIFGVDFLRIVRVDGRTDETYRYEASSYSYVGATYSLPSPQWMGSNTIFSPNESIKSVVIDFKTGQTTEWNNPLYGMSPDGTRAFVSRSSGWFLYDVGQNTFITAIIDYPGQTHVEWFRDSSAFFLLLDDQLQLIDREGNVIETTVNEPVQDVAIAPNKHAFAFRDEEHNLYLADINNRIIYDLCFQSTSTRYTVRDFYEANLAWSPDSRYLAFIHDNYLVIFDTVTFQNQVLDFRSLVIMEWYPLDYDNASLMLTPQADVLISPPATPTLVPTDLPTQTPIAEVAEPPSDAVEAMICNLEVLVGTNLRAEPNATSEQVGSAGVGMQLQANLQALNTTDYFTWWQLSSGGWVREDMVREDANCEFLPLRQDD